ncbi:MAG TPA: restriction endonuclease subunit S [Pirellulaceae bacterium]|nr:restriction endonuclease subunit S [Pirellulaceae bacterium]
MTENHWIGTELGQVVTLNYGWSLPESKREPGDVPVYGSNGVVGSHSTEFVKSGGVIVGRKGSAGSVHLSLRPFCPIDTTFYVAPHDTDLDLSFLYYLLRHIDLKRILGDVAVPGLNRDAAYKERVRYPKHRDEQQAIAAVLGKLQAAVAAQQAIIDRIAELKAALMAKLFTEGTRGEPQQETEIGPVPAQQWKIVPLGDVGRIGNGSTPKRDRPEYWDGGTIPWLTSAKIHETTINEADEFVTEVAKSECHLPLVKAGSLLVAITGQGKTLGNAALVRFDTCISQHLAYIGLNEPQSLLAEYVLFYLQTQYGRFRQVSQAGGTTKGALTCAFLRSYPLPVPHIAAQQEIADAFTTIERAREAAERRKGLCAELFAAMLDELMTGRIRVNGLDLAECHASAP